MDRMDAYFTNLKNAGRKFDKDLRKLEKIWEAPHLMVRGYENNIEEAQPYIDDLLHSTKAFREQVESNSKTVATSIATEDRYLDEVDDFYNQLKEQCEYIETLLSLHYGYQPLGHSSMCTSGGNSEVELSILTAEQMDSTSSSEACNGNPEEPFVTLRHKSKKKV